MRGVRVDPTLSVSGNSMMESSSRSSRLAVGEAAALMLMDQVPTAADDICITSLRGSTVVTDKVWKDEFGRAQAMMEDGRAAQLFSTSFAGVPDVERLADWIATKWAPAVMRTYDIAAIRTGARPVYANRAGRGTVEILWQQLQDDFDSVTAGKMIIEVTETSMTATRGSGDPTKGFGQISRNPLQGESVLVRRLADAASQAIEKGLADQNTEQRVTQPVTMPSSVVSSLAGVTDELVTPVPVEPKTQEIKESEASMESGPRRAGVRRSTRKTRGSRKPGKETSSIQEDGINTNNEQDSSFQ